MKALSVRQPWASMIANGKKSIETRVWSTKYRGPLLICAGLKTDEEAEWWLPDEPRGCVVAICELVDVHPMTRADVMDAMCPVYDRAMAWVLHDVTKVVSGRAVKGALGLFEVVWP